ncbi:unnamed protein product [Durusdinium trenchii]|uniref:Uncharacterized protein n=2 Tax=Durusdinium trenchii TaxID=1381693 RepID=A0ABP0J737_9DINO
MGQERKRVGFGHKAQCEGCSPWIHKLQRARETNRTTAFTGPDTAHDCRWVVPNRFAALADFWDEDLAKECGCNYGAEEDAQEQRAEIVRSTQSFSLAAPKPAPKPAAAPAPAPAPAPVVQGSKPATKPARDLRQPKLTMQKILDDLEGSEEAAYAAAFNSMSGGEATVQPDNQALRQFLEMHSGVTDIDTELLKIASSNEAFAIDSSSFVMMLRLNPVNESEALESFLRLAGGGDQISAEDCRTGLFQLLQSIGGESFSGDECDFIIDASMVSAGLQISMEQWVGFTKTAGRIARLANYAKAF